MRKPHSYGAKFSILGYFLFLTPLTAVLAFSMLLFNYLTKRFESNLTIGLIMFAFIMVASLFFSVCDFVRRRNMVDKPVKRILDATYQIATGNFDIKIKPLHSFYKYDEYDLIIENINKMVEELSKSEIMKSDFISNVSHEIKTPLSVIQNYAKLLSTTSLDEGAQRQYLQTIMTASQKLSNLVTNILKLNKLENQAIISAQTNINVGELARACVLQFEDLLKSKNLDLDCDIDDLTLMIEPSYLELIFNNLISNAIKFTDKGKIDISLKASNEYMVFKIKDTGCGMNSEVGSRIFEKFYQGDSSHSGEGNGLGLALVKKVIDKLGGTISVKSEEGKGTSFTVKLKRNIYD